MAAKEIGRNEIAGKIIHKDTRKPLKDLLVVAFDLDPDSFNPDEDQIRVDPDPASSLNDPKTFKSFDNNRLPNGVPGDRLGSVLTDSDGEFRISYDDSAFRIRRKRRRLGRDDVGATAEIADIRPDLFLVVLIAERAGQKEFDNVLFRSNWARINAGRLETYLIEISTEQLKAHELQIPEAIPQQEDVDNKFSVFKSHITSERNFRDSVSSLNQDLQQQDQQQTEDVATLIKAATVREIADFASSDSLVRFVQDGEAIDDAQKSVYKSSAVSIEKVIQPQGPIPGKGIKIHLYLTDEEKAKLEPGRFTHDDNEYFQIEEELIQEFLFKSEDDEGINSILFADNPISRYCMEKSSDDKCAMELTSEEVMPDPDEESDDDDDDTTGTVSEDIPKLINKVLFDKGTSIFEADDDLSARPNAGSVQSSVDSFSLRKGPADATAFYDFDMLQIAFSHVWQQLVDQTLVNLGQKAHFGLKNNGRKSIFPTPVAGLTFTKANLNQAIAGALVEQDPIPAAILKNFDIHLMEYEALSNNQRSELLSIANEINDLKNAKPLVVKLPFIGTKTTYVDHTDRIELLYEQGELIIENIRINKPNSTQSILNELQERLDAKYEFTVFAADKSYHSVNFGLMNTYRQKWEPISYQAGQLAKTIPMAPKEERKYSVTLNRKLKTTERQAERYNSMLESESNLTSRAESEIVAKAQKKSDFDFNVKVSYASSSSKLGIGKDASKDSSEAKKAFRESVLKAAQEFKDEWSLTVDTEESIDSAVTESGTISNPNEELSVTYLFYQLQRRYRVSEQLYRTMPVVLVAMDVPAPHEITEGWVIAHDWIIRRVLLDDSYSDALAAISQRNIGDDYSLRELRKSMREQRRLVRNLEREFSKLNRDVENKYRTFRESVDERIDEEHDKRFFKRRLIRYLFGDGERPELPDPEMAKALEQAAADDHAYAVEQAKQLSMSLQREANALHALVREYNEAMEKHVQQRTASKRLVTHIKENILYYMQAIWSMEPPDQRFMRLHKVKVPSFEVTRTCIVSEEPAKDLFAKFRKDGKTKYEAWLHGTIENVNGQPDVKYKALVEVADLDSVLGFKGNYMMFPLKKHNGLTKLMAAPYVDEAFGAMDPDQLSSVSLEELSRYICCLHGENPTEFEELKPVLKEWLTQLLADPLRNGDEVIVPTDSLFIEMLPSDKSLLEDFKLKHRQMDVMKVRAEVRQLELENVRYAARLLNDDFDDPEIDKRVLIEGGSSVIVGDQ